MSTRTGYLRGYINRNPGMTDGHQASDADWFRVYETWKAGSGHKVSDCVMARIESYAGHDWSDSPQYVY